MFFFVFVIARFLKGLKYCYERACGIFIKGNVSLKNQIEMNWCEFVISKRSSFYTVLKVLFLSVDPFNNVQNPKSRIASELLPALRAPPSPPAPAGLS